MKMHWTERWQPILVIGLFISLVSPLIYWDLAEWEADPAAGSKSMNCLVAALYWIGGKWLVTAVVFSAGLLFIRMGVRRRRIQKSWQARSTEPSAHMVQDDPSH
ncbi:MAG: hypothetical protein ACRC8S_11705 [Fimbriiglobus sp.]